VGGGRPSSLFLCFLEERVHNLLAAVNGGDDDEEGAAGDDEAQLAEMLVAVFVCGSRQSENPNPKLPPPQTGCREMGRGKWMRTEHGLPRLVQHQIHQLVVSDERAYHCPHSTLVSKIEI